MTVAVRGKLSERVKRLKDEMLSALPQVDIERIKFLMQVYQETEGQPAILRRAKLFYKLCAEKTIFIDDNPIVGTLTQYKYGSYFFPEGSFRWVRKTEEFALERGRVRITPELREWANKALDYWQGKSTYDRTREIILQTRGVDTSVLGKCGVGLDLASADFQLSIPDYAKVLNRGMRGIQAEIEEKLAKLDFGSAEGLSQWYFYQATALCLKGMMLLAQRYASLARKMAKETPDPARKEELERIAQTCERVPANPARNFYEAIQAVWFTQLGVWMETPIALFGPPGRFTQYMYPLYKKDKEEGRLTDEEAIELIHLYFIKINHLAMVLSPHTWAWNQSRLGQQLSLGGLTPEGEDATTELDYLVLEAQERIQLPEPLVNVVYHDRLPESFLLKCVELIRSGIGQPAFHDIRKAIERRLYYDKAPLEEARNVSIAGCVQSVIPGYTDFYWESRLNVAKMVELVLNDGKDPVTGTKLGPETGGWEAFHSYDDLYRAVIKQLKYFIPLLRDISRVGWNIARETVPVPYGSALVNDCIEKGKDLADGGARYGGGDGISFIGVIDTANSLAAIKKLVFEEKKVTLKQLKGALEANFEGYEELLKMCLDAPKYGNDDEYVDSIAKDLYDICGREHQRFPDYLGRPSVQPSAYSVTSHWALGRYTGALPSGRRAKQPLCDASVSAQPGTDKSGCTALVKSAAKVVDTVKYSSNHFNMKFHPSALRGAEGARKLLSLIKTYFDLGGYHVQFNCVSAETLKDAQLHPENYRNLIVRVAGFSAFFIHLDREIQDEIIKRTTLHF